MILIDGKKIAAELRAELKKRSLWPKKINITKTWLIGTTLDQKETVQNF